MRLIPNNKTWYKMPEGNLAIVGATTIAKKNNKLSFLFLFCLVFFNATSFATPIITTQPATVQIACVGSNVTFSVIATGSNLTYQWKKGAAIIPSATSATYTKTSIA